MPELATEQRDALGKALQLLCWIIDASDDATDKEWGVRELSQRLPLPLATVHRLLTSLTKHGLLQRNQTSGQYRVGMEFYRLALKLRSHFGLRNAALPVIQELVAKCNEAVFLGMYDPFRMEMMFVAVINSSHPLRYVVPINNWIPVYAGASGLAIMAFLPREERETIIKRTRLAPVTARTITDPVVLEEELARIRKQGYALSYAQRTEGAVAIAAPIWGPDGRVMGEINISIPESRFDASMESTLAELVVQHAQRIMNKLGGKAPSELKTKPVSA
jgi:DNA-binding IclR family transcriptional regulator